MSRIVLTLVLSGVLLLAAPFAVAQGARSGTLGDGHAGRGMHGDMTLLGVLAALDLTDEQRDEIGALMREYMPRIQELMMDLSAAQAEFQGTLRDSGYNEALLVPLAEVQGEVTVRLILLKAELDGEIMNILTPEQLELLNTFGHGNGFGDTNGCEGGMMGGHGEGCDDDGSDPGDDSHGGHRGGRP